MLGLLSMPSVAAASSTWHDPLDPVHIAGGELAQTCDWPTAVSARAFDRPFCTATLVHPQVVLLAAHCIDPQYGVGVPEAFGFGEDGFAPEAEVTPMFCGWPPQWDEGYSEGFDVGYCVLSQPVEADFIPPLMGCEWDALVPGTEVTIVGFGHSIGILDDGGWVHVEGSGPKRTAPQQFEQLIDQGVYLLGDDAGGCPGDSGGPAMLQMSDGTWRVIGAASRIQFEPKPPPVVDNSCGYGTIYSSFAHVMPWLEEETGFDITPCHDADGTWNPDERCTHMPLTPGDGASTSGTWDNGCASQNVSGPVALCGPPIEQPEPDPEPGSTGADETSGSDESGTGDSGAGGTSDRDDDATTSSSGAGAQPPRGESSGDGPGPADPSSDDSGDEGCGCRTSGDGDRLAWLGLLALGVVRRRRG